MKETSRFYSSLGLLIVLNAIVKPLWIIGIDRQVQNEVGTAAYGTYFSLFNLSIVFSFLLDWGLTNFYNRQLAANDSSIAGKAGGFIVIKLLLTLLYGGVLFFIAFLSGITRMDIVFYVFLIQALTSMFIFLRAIITSQQWFSTDAWISVLDKVLMIVGCGILLYAPFVFGGMTIGRFLALQTSCTALAIAAAIVILLKRKFHFTFKNIWPGRQIVTTALPFAIIILLMSFHARADGFLLERLRGPAEAGKYAEAYRLLDASNMIGYLFASFLLPYIARAWSENRSIQAVVLNVRHLVLLFSITLSCIAFFEASWIQRILYHQDDSASVRVLQLCIPALIGYSLVQVYGTIMTATGHIRAFVYITLAAVVLNTILNLFFIPSMGAKGCCLAALVSQCACGLATMAYCRQKINTAIDVRSGLIYIFIAITACGILYLGNELSVKKWLVIAATGVVTLVMVWITRLIDPRIFKSSS